MVNILMIISSNVYASKIDKIVTDTEGYASKILYVSLNKTYKALIDQFEKNNVNTEKLFFIDTITSTVMKPEENNKCIFLETADDIKTLLDEIIACVKNKGIETVIFDSLSSLTTYKNINEVIKFNSKLLGSLSLVFCSAILTCLKTHKDEPIIQDVQMKVDKCIELA